MKKRNHDKINAASLRQKAEERLKRCKDEAPQCSAPASEADMLKQIHELEVHQIELEIQNEALT